MDDGDKGGCLEFSVLINRRLKGDVVAVPFTLRRSGVHNRREHSIKCCSLSVRVGLIAVALENLDFIQTHKKAAAVAAALAIDFPACGDSPLEMELDRTEFVLRLDVRALCDHGSVLDLPGRLALAGSPCIQVAAIEKHFGIGWRPDRHRPCGLYDPRLRPVAVVDMVSGAGDDRRVFETFDFFRVDSACRSQYAAKNR